MKLTPIAANRNVISYNNGVEVLFSYSTPVAGFTPELGLFRTKSWYSSTTTKHINKYVFDNTNTIAFKCTEVEQDFIDNLVGK